MSAPPENEHPLYEQPQDQARVTMAAAQARAKRGRRPREDQPLLTYLLVAINVTVFLAGFASPAIEGQLFVNGSLFPPFVALEGQVYRLLTAMFLHGSIGHIFFNMYALYVIGSTLEPIFGRVRFLLIYFLGGLTGSLLSLALGDFLSPSVGASGAVFALFAAEAVHLYQHRGVYANVKGRLRHMLFLIGMNLFIGFVPGSRIDNWGHIGGVLGGLLLAWRIAPRMPRPGAPPRSMRDFARADRNPLRLHLPEVVLYVFALIGGLILTVNLLASQFANIIAQ